MKTLRAQSGCVSLAARAALLVLVALGVSGCTGNRALLETVPEPVRYVAPTPEQWQLSNGLKVFFYRDAELPMVKGRLTLPVGSLQFPDEVPSTVFAMGSQMRAGGTVDLEPLELDRILENKAANVSSSVSEEFGTFSFNTLSADIDEIFPLFADVVLRPRFDERRLSLWKLQASESIRRRADDPGTIARISFNTLVFGERSPYSFYATQSDVSGVDRLSLLKAHRQVVRPNGGILVLTGDLTRERAEALVSRYFSQWRPRSVELPVIPEIKEKAKPGVYFIEGPFEQATMYIGHLGVPRRTDDEVAIRVFNRLFGGNGFGSRLVQAIREEKGLAYVAYGSILPDVGKGRNLMFVQTKAESAGESLKEAYRVLKELQDSPATEEELSPILSAVASSRVFKIDSSAEAIRRKATLEHLGYPENYDEVFLDQLGRIKPSAVQEVANRRWNIPETTAVIVGNQRALETVVDSLDGEVIPFTSDDLVRARFTDHLVLE